MNNSSASTQNRLSRVCFMHIVRARGGIKTGRVQCSWPSGIKCNRLQNVFITQSFAARSSLHVVNCMLPPHLGMQQGDAAVPVHACIHISMQHTFRQHVIGTRLRTMCQYILTAQAMPRAGHRGLLLVNYNTAQQTWAAMPPAC